MLIGMEDITDIEKTTINLRAVLNKINIDNGICPTKIKFITTDNAANLINIDYKSKV